MSVMSMGGGTNLVDYAEDMAVQAAPFSCYDNGAPKAPNEDVRAQTAAEIAQFRVSHEPEFGTYMAL
jgi:hypothetical protein